MATRDEFSIAARRAIEHASAWRQDGPKIPAVPPATAQELRALFDVELPDDGRDAIDIVDGLAAAAEHGLVGNTHPNFYAWVQGSSHGVGAAADILTSAWGQNAAVYQTAPAAAIAEEVVARWLLDVLRLAEDCSVSFATGATMASYICLSTARSDVLNRTGYDLEEEGF